MSTNTGGAPNGNPGTGTAGTGAVGGNAGAPGAGAGTGQPSAGQAGSAPAQGTPSGTPSDWTSGFNDEYKGLVQNKGWKAPTDVLDSYRNLEKLVGAPQDQIIRMPKEDDPSAWDSVYAKLGRPATPEGYNLEVPKDGGSPEFAKWASEQFHKAGLSEKQGKAIVEAWNQFQGTQTQGQRDAANAKIAADQQGLKKEWGAAYDQNLAVAQRAAREFGVDPKIVDAMENTVGLAATMKFFNKIGGKLGDASFVAGNPGGAANGPMTPAQANAKISTLKSDPSWAKRYLEGGHKERAELEILHKYAHPDG